MVRYRVGRVEEGRVEAAAVEVLLGVMPGVVVGDLPSDLGQLAALVSVDRQTGAGDAELDQEQQEQHHHVEEQEHLVVLDGAHQAQQRDKEQEHTAGYDPAQNAQAGDDAGCLAVSCYADQQECDNLKGGNDTC